MYSAQTPGPLAVTIVSLARSEEPPIMASQMSTHSSNNGRMILENQQIESTAKTDVHIWAMPEDCTALVHALLASFSVIIVSELGDKTFIITAIMAMKNSRLPVFLASACALLLMTVLSVGMGVAVTVIPEVYTHYLSITLFLYFGFKMLKEAYDMQKDSEESEFEEVKRSLEDEHENEFKVKKSQNMVEDEKGLVSSSSKDISPSADTQDNNEEQKSTWIRQAFKRLQTASLFINVFTMIFVAEWGDRSQISTVILAAREDLVGVFVGSFVGHVLCSGLAVIGGKFVAEMISVRTMTILGGVIFLCFAAFEIISGP